MAASTWRQASPAPDGKHASSKKALLFVLAGVMLAILGTLAAWVLYPKEIKPPHFVTLAVREYKSPLLPSNPQAVQDSRLLLQRFSGKKAEGYVSQESDSFRELLRGLKQTKEETAILYLTALGRSEGDDVYVLPGDSHPDQPDRWIKLGEILAAFNECPAPHKLLLLDLMRPWHDVRLGVLQENFADHVHEYLAKQNLTYPILRSCAGGQVSHVSEELGHSIFAYYVDRGLSGEADTSKDRRVSLFELAEYVTRAVDQWAKINRGQNQVPTLGGKIVDATLAHLRSETPGPAQVLEKSYPAWLTAGWQKRDDWLKNESFRLAPRLFRHLETSLLQAEQRWRAGIEDDRLEEQLQGELSNFGEALAKSRPAPITVASASFQHAGAKSEPALDDFLAQLKTLLPKIPEPGVAPEKIEKSKQEDIDKNLGELKEKLKKLTPGRVQKLLFDLACDAPNLSPGKVLLLDGLVREAGGSDSVETKAFARLRDLVERARMNESPWPTEAVHRWLNLKRLAERFCILVALEPASLASGVEAFQKAETQRDGVEKKLFGLFDTQWKDVPGECKLAEQHYLQALRSAESDRAVRVELDLALLHLPSLAAILSHVATLDPAEESAWKNWLVSVDTWNPDNTSPRTTLLKRLHERYAKCLRVQEDGTAETYAEIQHLLASPIWSAPERQALWKASKTVGLRLHRLTLESPDSAPDELRRIDADALARRRVGLSLDLVKISGYPDVAKWTKLGKEKLTGAGLRTLWAKELPEALRTGPLDDAKKERLSRFTPLADTERTDAPSAGQRLRNLRLPQLQRERERVAEFLRTRYAKIL